MSRIPEILARRFPENDYYEHDLGKLLSEYEKSGLADTHLVNEIETGEEGKLWARVWEAMLYRHLRGLGFQPRSSQEGPDFRIVHQEQIIWIEAVTPSPKDIPPSYLAPRKKGKVTVGEQLDEEPLLRWTAVLSAKRARLESYKKSDIVGENDCTIIAVNSCRLHDWLQNDCGSSGLPFAVEAVFPVGQRAAPVTPEGQPDGATLNIPRYAVRNPKGKLVSTDSFCNPQYANVSAILGCYHKPTLNPDYQKTGKISLTLVHNPLAAKPLPKGILDVEKEYVAEVAGDRYVLLLWSKGRV